MRQYEAYSVLITDEKGKRGTGTLFYAENAASFYVLTCAHAHSMIQIKCLMM